MIKFTRAAAGIAAGTCLMLAVPSPAVAAVPDSVPGVRIWGPTRPLPHVTLRPTHVPGGDPAGPTKSYNPVWDGYADAAQNGTQFTYMAGEFKISAVNCAKSSGFGGGYDETSWWGGLDGWNTNTVEQEGVDVICTSTTANPVYAAWYEMYPNGPKNEPVAVSAGDLIQVITAFKGNQTYELQLSDLTSGGGFSLTEKCPARATCTNESAEMIAEDPGGGAPDNADLTNFSNMHFTDSTVDAVNGSKTFTDSSFSAESGYWKAEETWIDDPDNNDKVMATTSGLSDGGRDFTAYWKASL